MLPFLEVSVMSPATPVMAPMETLPSATIATSPPPSTCSEVRFRAPVCTTVRSPGRVITTAIVPTSVVRLRSPPTETLRFSAVTVPPSVTPPLAASCTVPPFVTPPEPLRPTLTGETMTRSLVSFGPESLDPATRLINSPAFGVVGSDTMVRLSLAARPKLPGVRSGMMST